MRNTLVGELLAEFLGTAILCLFGIGAVAQVVTAPDGSLGDQNTIAWGWGLGLVMGIFVAARLSGGHLNPAVSVGLACFARFPWMKVGPYALAQTLGAFVAALVVRGLYADRIALVDPGTTGKTQGIFGTLPAAGVSPLTALLDQVTGAALLVVVIMAVTTAANHPPLSNLAPLIIGMSLTAIGMAWGANAGFAINPARDLGPRLASWLTGYEYAWWTPTGYPYWWVPIVGPLIGGVVGAGLFAGLIRPFLPVLPATTAAGPDATAPAAEPTPPRHAAP